MMFFLWLFLLPPSGPGLQESEPVEVTMVGVGRMTKRLVVAVPAVSKSGRSA